MEGDEPVRFDEAGFDVLRPKLPVGLVACPVLAPQKLRCDAALVATAWRPHGDVRLTLGERVLQAQVRDASKVVAAGPGVISVFAESPTKFCRRP
jgi:hypothetical protein